MEKIEKAFFTKMLTLGVPLDTEGAFDKVTFKSIDMAVKRHAVNVTIRQSIEQFLCNRFVHITVGNDTERGTARRRCPTVHKVEYSHHFLKLLPSSYNKNSNVPCASYCEVFVI